MEKIIFLKYGELSTKKDNRNFFIKTLNDTIKKRLNNIEITYDFGRMFIKPTDNNYDAVIDELQHIFGIHEIVIAYKSSEKEIDAINNNILELLQDKNFTTFKVEVKRSDKKYPINSRC